MSYKEQWVYSLIFYAGPKPGYNGHFNAHSYSAFDGEALIFFSKCVFESCSNYDFQILTKLNFKKESILLYRTSSLMFTWKKSIWISNFKAAFWNVHYIPGFTRPTPQATRTTQFWIWVEYPMYTTKIIFFIFVSWHSTYSHRKKFP